MDLLHKIFRNTDNARTLAFLKLSDQPGYYKTGEEAGSAFDEGSKVFFYKYGADIPSETNVTIGIHNMFVNPVNGKIFAFQHGRFTFVFRCDFSKTDIQNTDALRKGLTLDDKVDFTALGENWAMLACFSEEEKEQLDFAYELAMRG